MKTAKIFIFLIFISLIVCFNACKTVDKTGVNLPEIYIDLSKEQSFYDISNDIESDFEVIAMETTDECLIGLVNKIVFANNQWYILNHNRQLFIFDPQGKLVRKLDKLGRGPGEYLSITSFAVIGEHIWIYDNAGFKIMCYDENLENIETIPFSNTVLDVESFGDVLLLATNSVGYDKINYQLYLYDTQKHEMTKHLTYKAQKISTMPAKKERQFAEQNNACLFIYAYSKLIYEISGTQIEPKYKFIFSERYEDIPITINDYTNEPTVIRGISSIKETSSSIILEYTENQRPKYSIYNKATQQCVAYQNTMRASSLGGLLIVNYLIEGDYLIASYLPEHLLNPMIVDVDKIVDPTIKKKAENLIATLNGNDNPVILKFKLKSNSDF